MEKNKQKRKLHEINIDLQLPDEDYDKMKETLEKYHIEYIELRDNELAKDYTVVIKIRKNDK